VNELFLIFFSTDNDSGAFGMTCISSVTGSVYLAGLHPNFNTSSEPTIPLKYTFSLMFSDLQTTVPWLDEYLETLKKEIVTILDISSEWIINIALEGDLPKGRRSSLTSNLVISIEFTSISAGPGELSTLQRKLESPAFLERLKKGFKASLFKLNSTKSSMGSTSGECYTYPLHEISLLQAVYRFVF
jgi:hypothetical protein